MTFQIIIKGKSEERRRLKGKGISEFGKNLESEGWPSEFYNEEVRDRIKFAEKKEHRPANRVDASKIAMETGIESRTKEIERVSREKKLTRFQHGFPDITSK